MHGGRTRGGPGEEGSHTLDVALLAKVKGMRLEAHLTRSGNLARRWTPKARKLRPLSAADADRFRAAERAERGRLAHSSERGWGWCLVMCASAAGSLQWCDSMVGRSSLQIQSE